MPLPWATRAAGRRYAIDLPTPVPASTAMFVDVENALVTARAMVTCSSRDSNPSYIRPTMPSRPYCAAISSGAGNTRGPCSSRANASGLVFSSCCEQRWARSSTIENATSG